MPKRRYEHREPTHEWQQIRPLFKDTAQINYEVIRPVILGWQTPQERGGETGVSPRTIYYRANLFDQAGMASLLPPEPPPPVPKLDKRSLPPDIRQEIVDLHTQYPAFHPHEIATICFVKFGRKPAPLPSLCGDGGWRNQTAHGHSAARGWLECQIHRRLLGRESKDRPRHSSAVCRGTVCRTR